MMISQLLVRAKRWPVKNSAVVSVVILGLISFQYTTFAQALMLPACNKNHCGYIYKDGTIAIPLKFDEARKFSEGVAAIRIGIKWGYIDAGGSIVIETRFYRAGAFSAGLAPVQEGNKWGFIDKSGRFVIAPKFNEANSFSDGYARVRLDRNWIYIDDNGREAPVHFWGDPDFLDGLTPVVVNGGIGFVDRSLTLVIQPRFQDAAPFSEGLAPVLVGNRWGYIDKSGRTVVTPRFFSADRFSEGLAVVQTALGKYAYCNRTGRIVIPPKFSKAYSFSQGLASVRLGGRYRKSGYEHSGVEFIGGRRIYINKQGKTIIRLDSNVDYASGFVNDVAFVRLRDGGEGYIDKEGNYIWNPSKRN